MTERELAILAFERGRWNNPGAKEQAIKDTFDLSANAYYQLLNHLIDQPEALMAEPMLVKRLRRVRQAKARARSVRNLHHAGE